jgi:hypothetical protein
LEKCGNAVTAPFLLAVASRALDEEEAKISRDEKIK